MSEQWIVVKDCGHIRQAFGPFATEEKALEWQNDHVGNEYPDEGSRSFGEVILLEKP